MKPKKKTKVKVVRPLSISIHGEGLDIEASFSNDQLSKALVDVMKRVGSPSQSQTIGQPIGQPAVDALTKLMETLDEGQVEAIRQILTTAQQQGFVDLIQLTRPSAPKAPAAASETPSTD